LTLSSCYGTCAESSIDGIDKKELPMPNEEWGVKRVCPTTGKRFYDLNKDPIVSPYTGDVVELDTSKTRMISADSEDMSTKRSTSEDITDEAVLIDEDEDVDLDLGDDVLDEDADENVPLEDIADVSSDEEDL
tara:strand:+ start:175 stop:573 length:399 start_codon:yes stop_codon:yes gene_type:complete